VTGDSAAETRLFEALAVRFGLFARHHIQDKEDADDVAQDALAKIARTFRELKIDKSFSAWAYRVLRNEISNYYRTRAVRTRVMDSSEPMDETFKYLEPDPMFEARLLGCLQSIAKVNRRYARILVLSFQGLDSQQICRRLKVTRANLYTILSRARDMLKRCLNRQGGSHE
jgi:RNA polymerase sigma-70 factor (ECF subfamily)